MNRTHLLPFALGSLLLAFELSHGAHAAGMDRDTERQLRSEIRKLRNFKGKDGKTASWQEVLESRQRILDRHEDSKATQRWIHERFFWDVVRRRRGSRLRTSWLWSLTISPSTRTWTRRGEIGPLLSRY